ncbi:MAG: MobF family relaxase, partial [Betaproteobacteria bacterium]
SPETGAKQQVGRVMNGQIEHRPGLDLTFSAPKSVSIVGLVGEDNRIFAAHEAATERAMQFLEKQAATRVRVQNQSIEYRTTGNLVYAKFQHETSRRMDPQIHTHVAVANATWDDRTGQWRSLEYHSLVRDLKTADSVYKNELAQSLKGLGYELEWTKNGPEIKGINREQIEHFSKRTTEIDKELEKQGLNREEANAVKRSMTALKTRDAKRHIDRKELLEGWKKEARSVGLDVDAIRESARIPAVQGLYSPAKDVVAEAIKHLGEREQSFSHSDLLGAANEFARGRATNKEIEQAIGKALEKENLISRGIDDGGRQILTTPKAIKAELSQIEQIVKNKGKVKPIYGPDVIGASLKACDLLNKAKGGYALDEGQHEAAKMVLISTDRFTAIQGYAGAGKTSMLETVKRLAEYAGYEVKGMSNGAEQAHKMQMESGIKSSTVASFIGEARKPKVTMNDIVWSMRIERARRNKIQRTIKRVLSFPNVSAQTSKKKLKYTTFTTPLGKQSKAKVHKTSVSAIGEKSKTKIHNKQLWIVDEAGQLGQKHWNTLQTLAEKHDARIVFIGDKGQHQSVGAGRAFENAQNHMQTATLDKVYRQQDVVGKAVVADLITVNDGHAETSEGVKNRFGAAFDKIAAAPGQFVEVRDAVNALEQQHKGQLDKINPHALREARQLDSNALNTRVADVYLEQRKAKLSTMVFTATNASRIKINEAIRQELKAQGEIYQPEKMVNSLSDLKLTDAQKREAWRYQEGMIVQSDRKYDGLLLKAKHGEQFEVLKNDEQRNTVRMKSLTTGKEVTFNPQKKTGFSLYESHQVGMSVGDEIRFVKNNKELDVRNGTKGKVTSVTSTFVTVQTEDKKNVQVPIKDNGVHLQHSYASTTYRDQGNQAQKGIYVIDVTQGGGIGQRDAYVGFTRAQEGTIIVTNDKLSARDLVMREQNATTALADRMRKKEQSESHEMANKPHMREKNQSVSANRDRGMSMGM